MADAIGARGVLELTLGFTKRRLIHGTLKGSQTILAVAGGVSLASGSPAGTAVFVAAAAMLHFFETATFFRAIEEALANRPARRGVPMQEFEMGPGDCVKCGAPWSEHNLVETTIIEGPDGTVCWKE